ncbi:hypothetical protein FSS13T_03010 [Flavobacterium saliperosum S13]|uniref:Uncharacterized protein n=2 Tax=Flavobacterium saliperosum TaxID=329186 RepID=A0A1G4V563_9FLAO|nr:hypothetical protein [Flavobacterium saliperosum]ESU27822.1 hypothetical protein FSS13T_03010 [Flavobacterium saliperosum S13]SCX01356.1 hypothetical protein SAMN02927925_00316 [Flavobacterium saliperosum]
MLKNNLEEQFNDMLPYVKDNSKAVIDSILKQAEEIDNQSPFDVAKAQKVLVQAGKVLSLDRKMKKLFKKRP